MPSSRRHQLPERHSAHRLETLSRDRFRTLFRDPLFVVRDEAGPDYGADLSIEALLDGGRNPTNIRSLVQLKGTAKAPATSGEHRLNIKISNIHYMRNSHSSFYCLYAARADRFYYRSTVSVFEELRRYEKIPAYKRFLTVAFTEPLDAAKVAELHAHMVTFADAVKAVEQFWASDDHGEITFGKYPTPPEPSEGGYAYRLDEYGNQIRMEHEIWLMMHGAIPRGYEVFHKNGQMLDNRRDNLALRPIDPRSFAVNTFDTQADNISARNILRVIVNGKDAEIDPTEPPEPMLFWDVIRSLQKQGMSMMQSDVARYKAECEELLGIRF
jgi:hypothetical protein